MKILMKKESVNVKFDRETCMQNELKQWTA